MIIRANVPNANISNPNSVKFCVVICQPSHYIMYSTSGSGTRLIDKLMPQYNCQSNLKNSTNCDAPTPTTTCPHPPPLPLSTPITQVSNGTHPPKITSVSF